MSSTVTGIIGVEGLKKSYRTGDVEVEALRGVDLLIQEGEMLGIMGPSGCGKTTLLNCLSGIDEPTAGTVTINERDIYQMKDRERSIFRAEHMGFIFQFFNLLPVLSVVENVEMPLLVSGVPPKEARLKAIAGLQRIGLESQADKRPMELSGGQQQRVAIARALVNDPAIVWCDEPTGNLDSKTADDIMGVLTELNREKRQTFVIVTHSEEVGDLCHRVVRMRDGLIVDVEKGGNGAAAASDG